MIRLPRAPPLTPTGESGTKEGRMATSLLATKLYTPPVRPGLVSRPGLVERLEGGLQRRLSLISAPAGFGKTTLLSEWAARTAAPVAWLSLDAEDSEPTRFWSYVIAALQTVHPAIGEASLTMLRSPQAPPIETVLTSLINEVAAISDSLALVLDDYHLVEATAIHDAVSFLLDHLPPQAHLVVATRSDPPLPLSRLRGRGQMTELRTADLRFTPEETAAFLNEAIGLALSAEDLRALETRTEGWAVGLQMVALSLQGQDAESTADFITTFSGSHRYVLDYLTDEVLLQQPESVRDFLLQTSILDRLTGPLCDAVTGEDNGQETLGQLEATNLFIVPLDAERRWYRYHHLFADLLHQRLSRTQPDLLPVLHLRASGWHEQSRLIPEAVRHALAAGDTDRAARLVGGNALAMMEHGELATLERWLGALAEGVVRTQPWLGIARAWILAFTGRLDEIEPLLRVVEEMMTSRERSAEGLHISGHVAAVRACVAGIRGEPLQAAQRAREALERLPEDDRLTRGWTAMALGIELSRSGDGAAADEAFSTAVTISRATGDSHVAVLALCNQGAAQVERGQLVRAADTLRGALRLAEEYAVRAGRQLPVRAYAQACLGVILCEWNEVEAGMSQLREAIALCERWGEPQLLTGVYRYLAGVLQSIGDVDGALGAIGRAKEAARGLPPWFAARAAPQEALIQLRRGDTAAASRWAASQKDAPGDYPDLSNYWFARLVKAQIDIARGRLDEALRSLGQVREVAESEGRKHSLVASLVLQAIALEAQGELDQALAALERALSLAEPEGYVRLFIEGGAPMTRLLHASAARGIAAGYVGRLLAAMAEERDQEPTRRPPPSSLIEPLTERELGILRLIDAGLSNREIAEELYLSINTVKHHTKSIYSKLGVRSRTQAASRARELGLL